MTRFAPLILLATLLCVGACGDDGAAANDAGGYLTDLPPDEPFGRACDNPGGLCPETVDGQPLTCISPAGGGPGRGYCALNCRTPVGAECMGVPNGTWASCLIKGTQADPSIPPPYFCAFVCETASQSYMCPPTLVCVPEKDGSGRRICVPPAL